MERDVNSHKWMVFNREYRNLGTTTRQKPQEDGTKQFQLYSYLTDSFILELTDYNIDMVKRDDKGNICKFWLYDDRTNPMNQKEKENHFWNIYWNKLQKLSQLIIMGL